MASKDRGSSVGSRCALRISCRNGCCPEGTLSVIDRVVGFVPGAVCAEYAEFPETVEGVRVLLLSVSGDVGSRGHGGSEPESVGGSDNLDDSPKAVRGGVGTLVDCVYAGGAATRILTSVRYCLATAVESAASTEVSRLLLEALSPGTDVEGAGFGSCVTLLTASMRRLLRVSGRLVLLTCCTPEGVSSIWEGLGGTLLIQ